MFKNNTDIGRLLLSKANTFVTKIHRSSHWKTGSALSQLVSFESAKNVIFPIFLFYKKKGDKIQMEWNMLELENLRTGPLQYSVQKLFLLLADHLQEDQKK